MLKRFRGRLHSFTDVRSLKRRRRGSMARRRRPGGGSGGGGGSTGAGAGAGADAGGGKAEKPQQRNAANARERARMRVLSRAFCRLKTTLPWVPADTKLSKLDTLRLATSYIAHLRAVLADEPSAAPLHPLNLTWPFSFQHQQSHHQGAPSSSSTEPQSASRPPSGLEWRTGRDDAHLGGDSSSCPDGDLDDDDDEEEEDDDDGDEEMAPPGREPEAPPPPPHQPPPPPPPQHCFVNSHHHHHHHHHYSDSYLHLT